MSDRPTPAPAERADRRVAWVGRWGVPLLWVLLPLVAGPAFAAALDPAARSVQLVASIGLWAVWAVGLGAALLPRTTTLTAVRVIVPAALPALGWALLALRDRELDTGTSVALAAGAALALVAVVLVLSAPVGDVFANGSSYGDERRMLLRPPAALLLGPVELAWVVCVAGAVAGPMLLAAEVWLPGVVLLPLGWAAAAVAARALHGLAKRWVVFVPAGFVLHDLTAMTEALLVPRRMVERVGPALADTTATDLTAGALGLALQVDLTEPTPVTLPGRRGEPGETVDLQSALFSPSRPGALLREAARRRIKVG